MDSNRFDTIAKLFADRRTRRAAVKAGGGGLAAAAFLPAALRAQEGTPQVATPVAIPDDPHPSADTAKPDPEFLFAQIFQGGAWAPKDGEEGTYTLTLTGAAANTVYFSDRPERIAGLSSNQEFLDGLGFTPTNPPNAALVAAADGGDQDVLVIELLNPAWDGNGTLTYDAKVLADYGETGLAHLAQQQANYEFPESFGEGGLFIDDCSDSSGVCYQLVDGEETLIGEIGTIGECYHWGLKPQCEPCNDDYTSAYYGELCAQAYPDQCIYNSNGVDGWDCFVDTSIST
jgi:hypothetical protein